MPITKEHLRYFLEKAHDDHPSLVRLYIVILRLDLLTSDYCSVMSVYPPRRYFRRVLTRYLSLVRPKSHHEEYAVHQAPNIRNRPSRSHAREEQ